MKQGTKKIRIKLKDAKKLIREGKLTEKNYEYYEFLMTYKELIDALKEIEKETKKSLKEALDDVVEEFELGGY